MKWHPSCYGLVFLFSVIWNIFCFSSLSFAVEIETDESAVQVDFHSLIELEQEVHFLTPAGEDIVVPPGPYTIEAEQTTLQLILDNEETTQPITIQTDTTTHEKLLNAARPVSVPLDTDQHVIALLLPNGKAIQAIGSYSGVRTRRPKLKFGWMKGLKIPRVNGVLTTPKFGSITPGGKVVIKGKYFGAAKGKVVLHGRFPFGVKTLLTVEQWNPTKITATVPRQTLGLNVRDQKTKFQILTAKGVGGGAWKVRFRANRDSKWLEMTDKAVKMVSCSAGGDINDCNGRSFGTGGEMCVGIIPPTWKDRNPTIFSYHRNCDVIVDWDEGTDRYAINLKNGWVFKKIKLFQKKSSSSEKIRMPSYSVVNKLIGSSSWSPKIRWEISPGPDEISYGYYIQIEGPRGIPYY